MFDYFVVGDYNICGKVKQCLIRLAGSTEERAKEILIEVQANPPQNCLGNIHIEREEKQKCWWNDKLD